VVSIAGALALALAGWGARDVVLGWAVVTVAAGAAQLALQAAAIHRAGWRPRLGPPSAARNRQVAAVTRALAPAMIGAAVLQLDVFVATIVVSGEPGAVAQLNYAFRFLQLPLGVFAAAIATVATTRLADAAARGDRAAMADELAGALRPSLAIAIPAAVGLIVDGRPIVALVYQHGAFAADDTDATAAALTGFALGLPAYAAIKVLLPAWFALGRARATMLAALASVVATFAAGALVADRGPGAVAAVVAVAATLAGAILYAALGGALGARLPHRALAAHAVRIAIASAAMGGAAWATRRALEASLGAAVTGVGARAAIALAPVAVGVAVFALAAAHAGVDEARALVRPRRGR
jgi:putative peptidoglycan lipid II flippase